MGLDTPYFIWSMPIPLSGFPGSKNTWNKQMDTFHPLNPLCEVYRIPKNSRKAHQQRATIVTANQECTKLGKGESLPDRMCVLPTSLCKFPPILHAPSWSPTPFPALPSSHWLLPHWAPTAPQPFGRALVFSLPQGLGISSPSSFLSVPHGLFQN